MSVTRWSRYSAIRHCHSRKSAILVQWPYLLVLSTHSRFSHLDTYFLHHLWRLSYHHSRHISWLGSWSCHCRWFHLHYHFSDSLCYHLQRASWHRCFKQHPSHGCIAVRHKFTHLRLPGTHFIMHHLELPCFNNWRKSHHDCWNEFRLRLHRFSLYFLVDLRSGNDQLLRANADPHPAHVHCTSGSGHQHSCHGLNLSSVCDFVRLWSLQRIRFQRASPQFTVSQWHIQCCWRTVDHSLWPQLWCVRWLCHHRQCFLPTDCRISVLSHSACLHAAQWNWHQSRCLCHSQWPIWWQPHYFLLGTNHHFIVSIERPNCWWDIDHSIRRQLWQLPRL